MLAGLESEAKSLSCSFLQSLPGPCLTSRTLQLKRCSPVASALGLKLEAPTRRHDDGRARPGGHGLPTEWGAPAQGFSTLRGKWCCFLGPFHSLSPPLQPLQKFLAGACGVHKYAGVYHSIIPHIDASGSVIFILSYRNNLGREFSFSLFICFSDTGAMFA